MYNLYVRGILGEKRFDFHENPTFQKINGIDPSKAIEARNGPGTVQMALWHDLICSFNKKRKKIKIFEILKFLKISKIFQELSS